MRLLKASEIEAKVKQVSEKGVVLLLYKTARTDMDILDEEFGPMNWQSEYREIKENMYAGIGVRNNETGEWVWKWDCGIESRADGDGNEKKGEASDAFKRAGFKWGIGRELYTAPMIFIPADAVEIKKTPKGSLVCYEKFDVKSIEYNDKREITKVTITGKGGRVVWSNDHRPQPAPQAAPQAAAKPAEKAEPAPAQIPAGNLSNKCALDIMAAQTTADLVAIYNAYCMNEPVADLKAACAAKRQHLESGNKAE